MSSYIPIRYPLDLTGVRVSNLVTGEKHSIAPTKRYVALNYGPFYQHKLKIYDTADNRLLTESTDNGVTGDYMLGHLYDDATARSAKQVVCTIFILNTSISEISVTAQMVGGDYTYAVPIIEELLNRLTNDDRPIHFGDLVGLPEGFPPATHLHSIEQVTGWDRSEQILKEIRDAILLGDQASHVEIIGLIQALAASFKWATSSTAIEGTATDEIISPATLKAVLDDYAGLLEVELPYEDQPWGYLREPRSGLTFAFGTGGSVPISNTNGYFCAFKRSFSFKPILVSASLTRTTDSITNIGGMVELTVGVPEHLLTREGLYYIPKRIDGSGTDTVKLNYLAVGLSDDGQPIATVPGFETPIPPSETVLKQPVWSGSNALSVVVEETGTFRIGIIFASNKSGGGYLTNTNAQAANGDFFYTQYPTLFTDADYEVRCVQASTTGAPNFTVMGRPLDTWVNLGLMKAQSVSNPLAGFVFNVTNQVSGSIAFDVTIRNTATGQSATRTFTLSQTSSAVQPQFSALSTSWTFNTETGDPTQRFRMWFNSNEQVMASYTDDAGVMGAPFVMTSYSAAGLAGYIAARMDKYEVLMPDYQNTALVDKGYSSSGIVEEVWHPLDQLVANNSVYEVTMVPNKTHTLNSGQALVIRHKTDTVKRGEFSIFLNKAGNAFNPIWSGNYTAEYTDTNPSTSSGSYAYKLTMESPVTGQGKVEIFYNGSVVGTASFQYNVSVVGWNPANYQFRLSNENAFTGMTRSGPALGVNIPLTNAASNTVTWTGSYSSSAKLADPQAIITVAVEHIASGDSSTKQMAFRFAKNGYTNPEVASIAGAGDVGPIYVNNAASGVNHSITFSSSRTYSYTASGTGGSSDSRGNSWLSSSYQPSNYQARVNGGNWVDLPGTLSWTTSPVGNISNSASSLVEVRNKYTGATTSATFTAHAIGPLGNAAFNRSVEPILNVGTASSWASGFSLGSDGSYSVSGSGMAAGSDLPLNGRWLPEGFPASNWDIRFVQASFVGGYTNTGFTGQTTGPGGVSNGSFSGSYGGNTGVNSNPQAFHLGSQFYSVEMTNRTTGSTARFSVNNYVYNR